LAVAESGIAGRGDVARLEEHGFDAVLVGKALMTAPDPLTKLFELRGCGEAAEKPSTNPTDMDA
jgi:indole-3-glycerol phosphate synthase